MKSLLAVLALVASFLSFDTVARATDHSATRTNVTMAFDGVQRARQNPGFCGRNAGDYFCRAGLTAG